MRIFKVLNKKGLRYYVIFGYFYSFFALETAKSDAKPVVKPIKASPTVPTPSTAKVCPIAKAAKVETIKAPASFLAEKDSSVRCR